MPRSLRRAACALPLATFLAVVSHGPAQAHPHVWVETVTTFVFEDGRLAAIRQQWRFDPIYSSFVIEDIDRDGDGRFDAEEEARALDIAFGGLEEAGHFTHLYLDGNKQDVREVHDRRVTLDGDTVEYAFTFSLPEPVAPQATEVMVGTFDESYYVDLVGHDVDPVRFAGIASGACHFAILDDAVDPIYYGMVVPPVIGLRCGTS